MNGLFVPFEDTGVSKPLVGIVMQVITAAGSVATRSKIQVETKIDHQTLDHVLDYLVAANMLRANAKGEFRQVVRAAVKES